jgi:hypothetical protein
LTRAENPAAPAADSSGLTAHPQPIDRSPALTARTTRRTRTEHTTMTFSTVAVYLNTAHDSFLGFNQPAPAQLELAASLYLELDDHQQPHIAVKAALRHVFEQLNIVPPTAAWAHHYRLARRRSLSVGDVVVIGETAWACAACGWTPITADELRAALPPR